MAPKQSLGAVRSVTGWHFKLETIPSQLLSYELESLIVSQSNRPRIAFTLELSRRVFDISRHQFLDRIADRYHDPGALRIVVHEDVVALLRVLPQVEDLRNGSDIRFRAFPAEVGINGKTAGFRTVIAAQIEHRLVVAGAGGTRRQFVLCEIEPLLAWRLPGAEQHRR